MEPAGASPFRYWAFISYSSADRAWARWLHRAIEGYGIPARLVGHPTPVGELSPKRLRPVFQDRAELPATADLGREIQEALAASRYLIVICSPPAAQSKWVAREIELFTYFRGPENVLALLVGGKVGAGDQRECFPVALRQGAGIGPTPVAADVRSGGDGKRDAKLKLLAGMLGVGFDDLRRRDAHRRMRRLQAAVSAALAVAVGFAALAAYAEDKRSDAVEARRHLESQMQFLLYDLQSELQPLGRLDIVEAVQAQVDAYYAELGSEPDDPYARLNQAAARMRDGDLLLARGDPAGACEEYRAGLEVWQSFALSEPGDPRVLRIIAAYHDSVGRALHAQGKLAGALFSYGASLDIRQDVASSDTDDPDLQYELSTSHNLLGSLLWELGDPAATLDQFRASLTIKERLSRADPADVDLQYAVAMEHGNVGAVLDQLGDPTAAQEEYAAGLAVMEQLVAADFSNAFWQRALAALYNNLGASRQSQGDLQGALAAYQQAAQIMERLVASDPSNAEWQADLDLYQANMAEVQSGTSS